MLWRLAVLPVAAVVLGGLQRVAIQAVRVGLLSDETFEFLFDGWQFVQSVVVALIGIYTFVSMRRLAARLFDIEIVVGEMVDRVRSVSLEDLKLTAREQEVLNVIGNSAQIDDRSLAEKLGVSPDTVHSHVSSLLKKTKLRDRRDLMVVALLHKAQSDWGQHRGDGTLPLQR
jgi:DNA-binding CsgD family transcriptional regulator